MGETISPLVLNPFKNIVGLILFFITCLIIKEPLIQGIDPTGVSGLTSYDYFILLLSGTIGIGLADMIFFKSLNILGAGISAIVDCLYSPMVILFAFFMLNERLEVMQLIGAGLVVGSILFASLKLRDIPVTRKQFIYGVFLGFVSMSMMAYGIVLIKPILNKVAENSSKLIWLAGFRLIPGVIVSGSIFLYFNRKRELIRPLRDRSIWPVLMSGSILGAYCSLIFWIIGMSLTLASTASIINQSAAIFIFIFSWLILKETLTLRRSISFGIAALGVVLVFIGSSG